MTEGEPLTWKDLEKFIHEQGIQAEVVRCQSETLTVSDAAREMKTTPDQIIKSLLFFVKERPVMAIASGLVKVDRRTLAAYYGIGRKQVSLANPVQVLQTTGYEVGAVPPFGLREDLPTFIDPAVLNFPVVYAGGGAVDRLLRLPPSEIVRTVDAVTLDLHKREQ